MKTFNTKILSILLVLILVFAFASCKKEEVASTPEVNTTVPEVVPEVVEEPNGESALEEVKGVTIPSFEVFVNGVSITESVMAAYPVYSVQATSVNSSGTESTATYIGFSFPDLLDAAGLTEQYVWVQAVADDGYAVTFTGDTATAETTMIAISKDGSPFSSGPWFAPCSSKVSGDFLKGCVSILVNTTDGAPDMEHTTGTGGGGDTEGLPEILDRTDKVEFAPYSFKVNGEEVTNETLEGLRIYKITAVVTNNKGETVENTYTGYKLLDVLAAVGAEKAVNVKAIANDGFESVLTAEMIASDHTLVAIELNTAVGEDGTVWVAPCAQASAGSYVKLVVDILAE